MPWDVTIDWLGETFTFPDVPLTLTESFDMFADSPRVRSVSLQVTFPDRINPTDLILNERFRLTRAVARVIDQDTGDTHMVGTVDSPRFRGAGDPVDFSIREAPYDDTAVFPPLWEVTRIIRDEELAPSVEGLNRAAEVHNELRDQIPAISSFMGELPTFEFFDPIEESRTYPVVFGNPGGVDDPVEEPYPAAPAIMVDDQVATKTVLIAGHHPDPDVVDVTIFGPGVTTDNAAQNLAITRTQDAHGRNVTTVDISASIVLDLTKTGATWRCGWRGVLGGLSGNRGGLSPGAGDLLRLMMNHSTLRLDEARLLPLYESMNRFTVAGYLEEQVSPWQWVQENLIPILPIGVVSGRDGLYFAEWDPDAVSVDTFVEGPEFVISDNSLQYAKIDIINELTFSYRHRLDSNDYSRSRTLNRNNSAYAAMSHTAYGPRAATITTDVVHDDSTAMALAQLLLRAHAFAPVIFDGRVLKPRFRDRRAGDMVLINSTTLNLINREAMITAIADSGHPEILEMEFTLFDDPVRA